VDPRARLDDVENRKFLTLPGLKLQPLDHPIAIPTMLSWGNVPHIDMADKLRGQLHGYCYPESCILSHSTVNE
jgi:hypothetical protein